VLRLPSSVPWGPSEPLKVAWRRAGTCAESDVNCTVFFGQFFLEIAYSGIAIVRN